MGLRNTETQYGAVAKTAHWLMAFMLVGSFSIGLYMSDLPPSPTRLQLFSYHKWLGVLAFIVVALRWLWRQAVAPPPLPATMRPWEKEAARITHRLLYLFLFAAPLTGWLMSSAKGFQTVLFGKLPIPDLLSKDPPLGEALEEVHVAVVWLLLGLIVLHAAAALKHHFIDRDDVLARMTPGIRPPTPKA
ncbi:MAG TPA: cytochrome b [Nevskiaceae bacterium]|nr:cytochrome b [Nevskiaceae bacterium]